jgi:hypothetical protein
MAARTRQAAFAPNFALARSARAEFLRSAWDLFDDDVAALGLVRGHVIGHLGVGGEEGVEAPRVEQGLLSVLAARARSGIRRDHQPAADLSGLLA